MRWNGSIGCGTFIHTKKDIASTEWALRGRWEQKDAMTGLLPMESLHVGGISEQTLGAEDRLHEG